MQNLRVITGNRQEGKTTELLENYFLRYVTKFTVDNTEEPELNEETLINFRDNVKLVFIDASPVSMFKEDMLRIINSDDFTSKEIDEILNGYHIVYHDVDSWFKLIKIIKEEIKEKDCIFFIDNCEKHNKLKEFLELMLCYPNQDCENSFDIIMTYGK